KYQKEELPKIYLNSLQLLKSFTEVYGKDSFFLANPNIQNYYNFEFLSLIFGQTEDIFLIETKINSLIFFRKFFILPKIKNKQWHIMFSDFDNISPFHRNMFRQNIQEFFND